MDLLPAIAMTFEMLEVESESEEVIGTLIVAGLPEGLAKQLAEACEQAFAILDDDPEEEELVELLVEKGVEGALAEAIVEVIFAEGEEGEEPEINLAQIDGVYVLELVGELVEPEPEHLQGIADMLERVWAEDCRLAVDVTKLDFAQADVLGVIFRDATTATKLGGEIVFYGFREDLLAYAEQIHLADIVTLVDSQEQALSRLGKLPKAPLGDKRLALKAGEREGVRIVSPRGSIDPRTLAAFREQIERELESHEVVVLDCRDLTWISSTGYAFLAQLMGKVHLVRLGGPARLMHEVLGLGALIPAHRSRGDAIAAIKVGG